MSRAARHLGWATTVVALLLPPTSAAGDVRVRATASPSGTVREGESVLLTVIVEGSAFSDVSIERLPDMKNLRVLSGPSRSQETSWSLGTGGARSSSRTTLTYVLVSERTGDAEIPAIEVRVGSDAYRTAPILLRVVPGSSAPPSAPGGAPTAPPAGGDDRIFLRATATAREVWWGEPLVLEVRLYTRASVAEIQLDERPPLKEFWVEEIPVDLNAERTSATVAGVDYLVFPIARSVLVPTSSGDATIGPYRGLLQVRTRGGGPFDEFFGMSRLATVVERTEPLAIHVKPLPEAGRPDGFAGAVGKFTLRTAVDRDAVAANEAVSLKATVEGAGSLGAPSPPTLEAPPEIKVFEPKAETRTWVEDGKLRSRRTWEWVIVPLAPGEPRIPSLHFSFFDPASGTYRVLASDPVTLAVRRGASPGAAVASAPTQVVPERREIRYIKLGGGPLREETSPVHRRGWFVAAAAFPFVAAPAIIVIRRRRSRMAGNRGAARSRRAVARARRRLAAAGRRVGGSEDDGFHGEVAGALVDLVADRLGQAPAGLTYDRIDELLAERGLPEETRRRYRAAVEACDYARFVPEASSASRRRELLADAKSLVDALARSL